MNRCIKYLIYFSILLVWNSSLRLEAKEGFLINGKPVPNVVAQVNGVDIDSEFLVNEIKAWKIIFQRRGKKPTPQEEEIFAREKIDEAIGHELLFQKSLELQIKISQETIQREIENLQKKFPSREMFLSALAFQRLTIDKLTSKIEKQLAEESFLRMKIAPSVNVPDNQVEAYYQKHKSQYKLEAKYRVSHIFVATVNTEEEGEPADPLDRKKARRIIQRINLQAQAKIRSIAKQLKKGKDFPALCLNKSEDEATREKGGDMGEIKLSETLPSLASAIVELRVNQISDIVQSPYGYHILKLTEKIPERSLAFHDVQSDILNIILKQKLEKKRWEYLSNLKKTADIKIFL